MKKILLQTCCSPCACHPIEELKKEGFEVTLFFYNPNVHPAKEYKARLNELKKYIDKLEGIIVIEGEYEKEKWFEIVKGLEHEPEKGARCDLCYDMRLRKTADTAKKMGFQYFGSTLSISPHKKADKISELGKKIEEETGIKFYDRDWKKMNGFKHACDIAREYNFYRQDYCGCIFSKLERDSKTKTNVIK